MWGWIVAGVVGGVVLLYEVVANAAVKPSPKPSPKPKPSNGGLLLNVKPPKPKQAEPTPSQGTSTPYTVPGGGFVYTGAQAPAERLQAAARALAAVDPTKKQNEQLVRNFQDAAGLAQRPGGLGWDLVQPTGTDGRYGHDVAAVLGRYIDHPPPVSSIRPNWWGRPGSYTN